MRIEHLRVDAFGKLDAWDSGADPLGPLVVVLGPNEAGKSTLFSFLTTALYGFQPASRDTNPHVPWGSQEAGGEIRIRLSEGGCAIVARKLRSTPSGKLTLGGSSREIRNQPLPWVEHVPRTVFRQVFAITLAELAGLDEDTWARIQDRVLGSMGATDLRPARAVADALEREAGEIWRPNRRGNQRLRELHDEVRALRARRLDALERDRTIRALVEEREHVRHQLRELRAEREKDALVVRRAQDLLPVKRQLDRIEALRRQAGPTEEIANLPADLPGALRTLHGDLARLSDELAEIEESRREPGAAVERFDEADRRLLEHRQEIGAFVSRASARSTNLADTDAMAAELRELDVQLRTTAEPLFDPPWSEDLADPVQTLSLDLLRDRVARADDLRRGRAAERRAEAAFGAPVSRGDRLPGPTVVGALGAAGALLLGWVAMGGPSVAGTAGGALLAVAATLFVLGRSRTVAPEPVRGPSGSDALADVEREIRSMLTALPLRPAYLEPAGPALVSALDRLRDVLGRRGEALRSQEQMHSVRKDLDAAAERLAARLSTTATGGAGPFAAHVETLLRDAERNANAAETARGELSRLERRRARLADEKTTVEARAAELVERIAAAAGEDESDALHAAQRRIDAATHADRLADELARAHPDLEELRAEIDEAEARGASWVADDTDLAARRARVEEASEKIEALVARGEALDVEVAHLRLRETVDVVDGEALSLEEEERRLIEERDRKWLVAQLLREADRRFREEHQPDLVRRASEHLARLTEGRYDRLLVDEHGDGDLFHIVGPGFPKPIPLARPISTGTLEQAYLSLRLAMIDHLDPGSERLPLFVDEALVNWDAGRRDRGLELLAGLSRTRQVFAFTCHPEMAGRLEERGAQVLRLER